MTLTLSLRNTKVLSLLLSAILFSFIYLIFVAHTFAQTTTSETPIKTRVEARKERIEARKERMQTKLDERKLKVCQVKEKVLGNRLSSLTKMTTNMLEKFDKISTRTKEFYENKVVSAGGSVSNYDALVADIDSKKVAVDTALTTAKATSEGFSCDADDPKGALTQFRTDMQAVKSALKDYRTSIKNLIVAVKSAAKTDKPSPSPEAE